MRVGTIKKIGKWWHKWQQKQEIKEMVAEQKLSFSVIFTTNRTVLSLSNIDLLNLPVVDMDCTRENVEM